MINFLNLFRKRKIYKDYQTLYNDSIKLFWWNGDNNFGDELSKFLIRKISNKKVEWVPNYYNKNHYFSIGSILDNAGKYSTIWGSGFIKKTSYCKDTPKSILAVRGPLTRKRLLELGIDCPPIYGDPGLLLPKYYVPKVKVKYKLGIIPHFIDKENEFLLNFKRNSKIKIINIQQKNILKFIDDVNSCEKILSSSLHGLVISDAYGIPSQQIILSNNIIGNNFKFKDYYMSINKTYKEPIKFGYRISLDEAVNKIDIDYKLDIDLDLLLSVSPFN